MHSSIPQLALQRGGALITALSILLILTVLGISAMSTSALQERMAGNARDYEVAFEAAEYSLRAAEAYVQTLTTESTITANFSASGGTGGGKYSARTSPTAVEAWVNWPTYANPATAFNMQVSQQPQYIIQRVDSELGESDNGKVAVTGYENNVTIAAPAVFQITARGFGLSATSQVMLQSYYVQHVFP